MAKTALLIIDMQVYFAEMTSRCLPNILNLSSHFHKEGLPQFFTQHGHSKDELSGKVPNQLVQKWGSDGSIATNSAQWELMPDIKKAWITAGRPPVIAKNTYDAFINTELDQLLRSNAINRVVICGVMTDCCCETTARSAFNRGFETWMVEDACASANPTQHQAGLKTFEYAFGQVLSTNDVIERLAMP